MPRSGRSLPATRNRADSSAAASCASAPDGTAEVSYWTHAAQRGRGHARNALALLVGYAASIGVTRLEAHVAADNRASRRVAESAGFSQAGTFTDDGTQMIHYTREAPQPPATPS